MCCRVFDENICTRGSPADSSEIGRFGVVAPERTAGSHGQSLTAPGSAVADSNEIGRLGVATRNSTAKSPADSNEIGRFGVVTPNLTAAAIFLYPPMGATHASC